MFSYFVNFLQAKIKFESVPDTVLYIGALIPWHVGKESHGQLNHTWIFTIINNI